MGPYYGYNDDMKRPSLYATAVAGFSLHASPPAYARKILEAGPEADLGALICDMKAAYGHLKSDVGEAKQVVASAAAMAPAADGKGDRPAVVKPAK
jgi:hypothetical protein